MKSQRRSVGHIRQEAVRIYWCYCHSYPLDLAAARFAGRCGLGRRPSPRDGKDEAAIRLAQSALAEARYQAERAEAQFDAVESANQNVFHNLALKWEACLSRVRDCEARLQALEASRDRQRELTPEQRDAYLAPWARTLQRVWSHESTPPQLRKRLRRAVLVEIIATIKGREIHLLLHWKGGGHSHLVVPRNRTGEHRWTTDAQTER